MNLPNSLTVFRIFLIPLLIVVLLTRFPSKEFIGVAIFLAAALTDWLDGYLARRRQQITTFGTWLDPLADKLLVTSAFIALVEMGLAPAWMVVIIVGREVAVTGLRNIALAKGTAIEVSELGKAKMATQVVTITALILGMRFALLETLGQWALWLTVILALASAVQYFRSFWVRMGGSPVEAAGESAPSAHAQGHERQSNGGREGAVAIRGAGRPRDAVPPGLLELEFPEPPKRDVPTHR
jgi:CDP-diacylglycerol--glycerol-3-phosphate 3-phosphatidyltransferase